MQCLVTMVLGCLKEYGCLRSPAPLELSHTPAHIGVTRQARSVALICSCNAVCILEFRQVETALFVASQFLMEIPSGALGAIRHASSVTLSVTSGASMICPILLDGKRFWKLSGTNVDDDRGLFHWGRLDELRPQERL
jgi:hypothetical protein